MSIRRIDEFEELMFVAGNFIWSIGEIWELISELEGEKNDRL